MRPQLSIVVPVYNNWWMTARLLAELERMRDGVPFEVVVVDNASTDETTREIERFPWVRYLRHEQNLNFGGACNTGARAAEAPLVLFLNNDAYPLGDALLPLVRALDREEVVIAGGALFFEDGVTQCAGFVVLPNAHWHYSCRNLPGDLEAVSQSRDALGVSGAAMAVRTQWFLAGGGFDESFVNGFEDVDLCMRAREEGRAIRYVAESRFAHYEGASAGRYDRETQNERRFYERWSAAFGAIPRVARGDVGAITIHAPTSLTQWSAGALADLEGALSSFGHPVVRGSVKPWQRFDRRFRTSASLAWFGATANEPSVTLERNTEGFPVLRARGAFDLRVPWLPCAAPARAASSPMRLSLDPQCNNVAYVRANDPWLPGEAACAVVEGLTDDAAFGNVLLAQAGIPTVVVAGRGLERFYASDVATFVPPDGVRGAVDRFISSVDARERFGSLLAADAVRRFHPRRTAIRVVDLLCAARFGLERPAPKLSDSPVRLPR